MQPRALPDVESVAGREIKHRWKIRKIAGPVEPRRHEAGKIPERPLAPNVEPAFIGITRGKLNHRQRQWRIEREPGKEPYRDGGRSGCGRGRNPAQANAGDDIEQHQVAETHDPLRAIWVFGFGYRHAIGQETSPATRV